MVAVSTNLDGAWGSDAYLLRGDPRGLINDTQKYLATHKYVYMGMAGDQHWTVDPNWPASRASNCTGDCHARFLLAVEEGVMLGAEGWDEAYDKPLGNPLGPAVYTPATQAKPATLTRSFSTGTKVVFTYDGNGGGTGEISWAADERVSK